MQPARAESFSSSEQNGKTALRRPDGLNHVKTQTGFCGLLRRFKTLCAYAMRYLAIDCQSAGSFPGSRPFPVPAINCGLPFAAVFPAVYGRSRFHPDHCGPERNRPSTARFSARATVQSFSPFPQSAYCKSGRLPPSFSCADHARFFARSIAKNTTGQRKLRSFSSLTPYHCHVRPCARRCGKHRFRGNSAARPTIQNGK